MRRVRLAVLRAPALAIAIATGMAGIVLAEAPPARPKIGLVLSGGGARGGAHVGVLKVLEELRVPVDFVTGTSMGALVGGLYCSGTRRSTGRSAARQWTRPRFASTLFDSLTGHKVRQ